MKYLPPFPELKGSINTDFPSSAHIIYPSVFEYNIITKENNRILFLRILGFFTF